MTACGQCAALLTIAVIVALTVGGIVGARAERRHPSRVDTDPET